MRQLSQMPKCFALVHSLAYVNILPAQAFF